MTPKIIHIHPDGNGRYVRFFVMTNPDFQVTKPGMYVKMKIEDQEQYCVIVGAVKGQGETSGPAVALEFMTKPDTDFGKLVKPGAELELSDPMGGYNISDVAGRSVVCVAGGSGIAAILPVAASAVALGAAKVDVFYAETNDTFAYGDTFNAIDGVDVHTLKTEGVLSSNPHIPMLGMLTSLAGVQPAVFMSKPLVYACGEKDFVNRLKDAMIPIYTADSDFRLNF